MAFGYVGGRQTGNLNGIAWHRSKRGCDRDEPKLEILKPSLEKVLAMLLPDRELSLVNVNFPDKAPNGLRWTRQSVRHYDGKVVPGENPLGRKLFGSPWFPLRERRRALTGGPLSTVTSP